MCLRHGPSDQIHVYHSDLSEPLYRLSAFLRLRPIPAFREPLDDEADDLLNSMAPIFKPATELVDLHLQMRRLGAGPTVRADPPREGRT
jgi:hypothetical protein